MWVNSNVPLFWNLMKPCLGFKIHSRSAHWNCVCLWIWYAGSLGLRCRTLSSNIFALRQTYGTSKLFFTHFFPFPSPLLRSEPCGCSKYHAVIMIWNSHSAFGFLWRLIHRSIIHQIADRIRNWSQFNIEMQR